MACQIMQRGGVIMCKIRHARNDVIQGCASISRGVYPPNTLEQGPPSPPLRSMPPLIAARGSGGAL